jgi:hypothetical protein
MIPIDSHSHRQFRSGGRAGSFLVVVILDERFPRAILYSGDGPRWRRQFLTDGSSVVLEFRGGGNSVAVAVPSCWLFCGGGSCCDKAAVCRSDLQQHGRLRSVKLDSGSYWSHMHSSATARQHLTRQQITSVSSEFTDNRAPDRNAPRSP